MRKLFFCFILFITGSCQHDEEKNATNHPPTVSIAVHDSSQLTMTPPVIINMTKPPVVNRVGNPTITKAGFFATMQNYTTDNGIALDYIVCSTMDKTGNLWFGTAGGGVSCYDGKSFKNFTTSEGLVNNSVYTILEDRKGNLWFGTNDGISCYDGKSFKNFTVFPGAANKFKNVRSIIEDQTGNIWLGVNGGGILRYDGKSFTNYNTLHGLSSNKVWSIKEDKGGYLWICTMGGGVSRYNGKSFKNFSISDGLTSNSVTSVAADKTGNLWFGTVKGGVLRYDGKSFENFTTAQGLPNNSVLSITADRMGNLWFGTFSAGVSYYDGKSFKNITTSQGLANNMVTTITEDKTGNLWIGTAGGGVSRYDGAAFTNFTVAQGLAKNDVRCFAEDKMGNLWLGTNGGGVSRYDGAAFKNFTEAQGLPNNNVRSMAVDRKGNLWFGTFGGVSYYDGVTFTNFTKAHGLVNNLVISIIIDKNGHLWFGTSGGASRFDGNSFTNFTVAQGLPHNNVKNILEDRNGNLWFGTYGGGVSRFDGKHFTNYNTSQGLSNNIVLNAIEDRVGNLWFATAGGGISRYDGKTFLNFTKTKGLPDNVVTQVLITKEGYLALGTNFGIALLTDFTDERGQTDNKKGKVIPAQNNLKNEELKKYQPVFEIFNSRTGYPVKDVNVGQNTMYKDNKGVIWIGTGSDKTGMVRFDYSALNKKTTPPAVFIQSVKINRENICWSDLKTSKSEQSNTTKKVTSALETGSPKIIEEVTTFGRILSDAERDAMRQKFGDIKFEGITKFYSIPEKLKLPYKHNSITFDFAAIEPAKPYLVNYTYILEGYEKDWSPVTNKTTATFGNIDEGTYTFKLRAQFTDVNQSGAKVWTAPVTYSFKVLPPWWKTWWAYGIYTIAIAMLMYAFNRWRTLEINKKLQTLSLEHKLLRSQMNPHFLYNSLNSISNFIIKNNIKESVTYIANFAKLMRLILENSRYEYVALQKELDSLELYMDLQKLRFKNELNYSIDVDPEIDCDDVEIPPMLAQPFIENAIEHGIRMKGNSGKIDIRFKLTGKFITFEVEDNGIGRDKSKEIKNSNNKPHQSLATVITEERIKLLNEQNSTKIRLNIIDLKDDNGNAIGTKVVFEIPYKL